MANDETSINCPRITHPSADQAQCQPAVPRPATQCQVSGTHAARAKTFLFARSSSLASARNGAHPFHSIRRPQAHPLLSAVRLSVSSARKAGPFDLRERLHVLKASGHASSFPSSPTTLVLVACRTALALPSGAMSARSALERQQCGQIHSITRHRWLTRWKIDVRAQVCQLRSLREWASRVLSQVWTVNQSRVRQLRSLSSCAIISNISVAPADQTSLMNTLSSAHLPALFALISTCHTAPSNLLVSKGKSLIVWSV